MTNAQPQQNFYYINRRIGSTNYKVKVYFSDTERETMEGYCSEVRFINYEK